MRGFFLEKSWKASGTGTTTFNTSSNIDIPYGKYSITVEGKGASGNPNIPGNSNYNPGSPGNLLGTNPGTPGTYSQFVPAQFIQFPPAIGGGNKTLYLPDRTFYNPPTAGNPIYNPYSPGNYASTNPSTPGNAGANSSALGVTLPGGPVAQAAIVTAATIVSYYAYPDSNTYPVTVASGGYVTIKNL